MSRLFSTARATASCAERYRFPARSRDSSRGELAMLTGGTGRARKGRVKRSSDPCAGSIRTAFSDQAGTASSSNVDHRKRRNCIFGTPQLIENENRTKALRFHDVSMLRVGECRAALVTGWVKLAANQDRAVLR